MNKDRSRASGLSNVFALGVVSFFTDVSSEMVFSLLPTFLLGLPGASRTILGLIEGLAEALSYGLRAVSGIFSDAFKKRKAIVLVGYGVSNVVKPVFSVAQTAMDVLIIRVSDRVGKAVRTSPRDALLSESVPEERRGTAFGLHMALDQSGAILGPLLASLIIITLGLTPRDVFLISFIPGLAALFVLLLLVEERVGAPREFGLLSGMGEVLRGRFVLLLAIVGLFSLGAFNFSFVLLNAREAGIQDALIPLVYAVINVAHTVIAIPAGLVSDRIGKERVLVMGYLTFLASTLLLLLTPKNLPNAILIAVIFGLYAGVVETVQRALVPRYAESALRGTAYGLYYLVMGTAFFGANAIVGTLWDALGRGAAASYSAALTSLSIVGMVIFIGGE